MQGGPIIARTPDDSEITSRLSLHYTPAKEARDAALSYRVVDQASLEMAARITTICNQMHDAIETERKGITGPLRLSEQRVNGLFKPALALVAEATAHLKREMGDYHRRVNEARAEQAIAGQHVELAPPVAQGVSVREVVQFVVENPELVPRAFCSPDLAKIRDHMANGGVHAIPGVRFYTASQVRTARK